MQKFGLYIMFMAVASGVLTQTDYQFRILAHIDQLCNTAWIIRGVMLVLGGLMVMMGTQQSSTPRQRSTATRR